MPENTTPDDGAKTPAPTTTTTTDIASPPAQAPTPAPLAPMSPGPVGPGQPIAWAPVFGPQWVGPGVLAPPAALVAAGVTGLVAAAALPWDRPGVGWLVVALVAAAALVTVSLRPPSGSDADPLASRIARAAWGVATVLLLAVGAVRAAGWLFVLCVLAACVCGSLAVAGGRSIRGLFLGVVAVPIATMRALPWATRGIVAVRGRTGAATARTAAAVAVSVALLFVFGALLAGADAAFSAVLGDVLPNVDAGVLARWLFTFAFVGLGMLGACFLALAPPAFDGEPKKRNPFRRIEWALPVGALVALFAAFVAVQATVLFGGGEHVLRTAGLTYAEYARMGFWQLLTVTVLTLLVIAVAAHKAARETPADRAWIRGLLGGLALLTLVIVASALSRMWAYEQAYGFTRLRVLVSVCEIWLGLVFLLVLAAGVRLRQPAAWVPRAIVGTAVAALIGIAIGNPDGFIAERNVARYAETKSIDLDYLSQLSADAVPALAGLPEPLRTCVLDDIKADLDRAGNDEWNEWNLARYRARQLLAGVTPTSPQRETTCWNADQADRP